MAVQRIKSFERHIEKILLGTAALGLLGVVAWQVAGTKTTVKIDKGGDVSLSEAYNTLDAQARKLQGEIASTPTNVPTPPDLNLAKEFNDRRARPVSKNPTLAWDRSKC